MNHHPATAIDPEQLLQLWGLRISGGALRSVGLRPSGEGEPGLDEAMVVVRYIESTDGFELARPVLLWIYAQGRRPEEFPITKPGQNFASALFALGWGMHLRKPPSSVASSVSNAFIAALQKRLRVDPITVTHL